MLIAIVILSLLNIALLIGVRNLLIKVEKYEDVTQDQTAYLQNISNIVNDSQKHLQNLDEKGVFQADDEVGYFFEQMKNVQKELNRYMPPENYGKKEE